MTTSVIVSPSHRQLAQVRYLRSPMYISVQNDGGSRATSSMDDWSESSQPPPEGKSTARFLPDISTHRPCTNSNLRVSSLGRSKAPPLVRSQSLSDYWPSYTSVNSCPRNITKLRQLGYQSIPCVGTHSLSAPVITKSFEDTLLPTHNIFFAGRPRTPKAKKVAKTTEVEPVTALANPKKRPRHNRRVTFLDVPHMR